MPGDGPDRTWHVYGVRFPDIPHPKFFVCLGRSGVVWYGCLIGSELSPLEARNPDIMAAIVGLRENDYNFLSHDSYFQADEHFLVPEHELAQLTQVGIIAPRHRPLILVAVRESQTMKMRAQDFLVNAIGKSLGDTDT